MEVCETVFRIVILIFCLTYEGIDVQVTYAEVNNVLIHDINATSAVFACNKRLIVRCYGPQNAFVNWQINNSVNIGTTSLSAICLAGMECEVYRNFTGRYSFGYNSSTGISDLTINPVSLDDNSMEYKCNDGTLKPLKAVVKNVLGNDSFSLRNETSVERLGIAFHLQINCTEENVTISWFSTASNGTDYQLHKATSYDESECLADICIIHGKSKRMSSSLELVNVEREVGYERIFGFNISSDSFNVALRIQGTYKLKETYNDTTTSINNTTSSTNTNTTTTGISKSYLPEIIGSVCGFLGFLIIIIVITVCYNILQRRRKKEQQSKAHNHQMNTHWKNNVKK